MSVFLAAVLVAATSLPAPVDVGTVVYPSGWPDGALVAQVGGNPDDPDGDGDPGVTLQPGEHLEFMGETAGQAVDGAPIATMFVAASDRARPAALAFELLRCEAGECAPLSATSIERSPWGAGDLEAISVELPPTVVSPTSGSFLCLRVVNLRDQAMRVGFGTEGQPASVWLPTGETLAPPAPTDGPSPLEPAVPDDRRDLLAGTIGVTRPPPPFRFPIVLVAAAVLVFAAAVGAVVAIGWGPFRTRRLPVPPVRR